MVSKIVTAQERKRTGLRKTVTLCVRVRYEKGSGIGTIFLVLCVSTLLLLFNLILCINISILNHHIKHTNQAQATTAHTLLFLFLCSSHCMAANSSSRGITALGKRVANRIWTTKSPSSPPTSRYLFSCFSLLAMLNFSHYYHILD